ncbi:hypothetical protein EYF80_064866 [Liparis tanakae]|uniref:Uncharacterized protein n=1 Tax=Liparis tanakae TaxID=230148 RepID=A0A4Z2E876_9TELE|nr:hypothetical protein EYF80_064866 [Liparis tanakae]
MERSTSYFYYSAVNLYPFGVSYATRRKEGRAITFSETSEVLRHRGTSRAASPPAVPTGRFSLQLFILFCSHGVFTAFRLTAAARRQRRSCFWVGDDASLPGCGVRHRLERSLLHIHSVPPLCYRLRSASRDPRGRRRSHVSPRKEKKGNYLRSPVTRGAAAAGCIPSGGGAGDSAVTMLFLRPPPAAAASPARHAGLRGRSLGLQLHGVTVGPRPLIHDLHQK